MELWTVLVGAVAMLVIQGLKGYSWPDYVKIILSIAVSAVLAVVELVIIKQTIDWQTLLANTSIILATATTLYKLYFQENQLMMNLGAVGPQ